VSPAGGYLTVACPGAGEHSKTTLQFSETPSPAEVSRMCEPILMGNHVLRAASQASKRERRRTHFSILPGSPTPPSLPHFPSSPSVIAICALR